MLSFNDKDEDDNVHNKIIDELKDCNDVDRSTPFHTGQNKRGLKHLLRNPHQNWSMWVKAVPSSGKVCSLKTRHHC